eukprot:8902341-Alexandrium_andersonii.AAC.1
MVVWRALHCRPSSCQWWQNGSLPLLCQRFRIAALAARGARPPPVLCVCVCVCGSFCSKLIELLHSLRVSRSKHHFRAVSVQGAGAVAVRRLPHQHLRSRRMRRRHWG